MGLRRDLTMAELARPDDAPDSAVSAPVDAPAAAPGTDSFDESIREFESATAPPPAASPEPAARPEANYDEIDRLLADLQQPEWSGSSIFGQQHVDAQQQVQQQRETEWLNALQSENAQLRSRIQGDIDRQAFEKFSGEIQNRLPQHLPGDYAAVQLKAMAMERPELVLAFDGRHLDRRAVDAELRQVETALNHQVTDPARRAELMSYGHRLGCFLNSKEILRRATHEIVKRGREFHPIDETATADHDAVAAAVRGSSAKASPEPPPNFGNMSDKQLREYTKTNFGF
jgi:hypothetical protein